mmetsp:Transcript_23762/g.74785  ORF Transcript_23762/g.74785 Transcript_23762/m.74785 type:complete len:329 (-) Transcript_23762:213-1199(-)
MEGVLHLLGLHLGGFVPDGLEQGGGQVALAEGRDHDDHALALVLRAGADDVGGLDGGARADAAEDALLLGETAGHLDGLLGRHLHDLIDEGGVSVARHEAGADALDLVRAGLAAGEHGGLSGLDGHDEEVRVHGLEELGGAGERAAGADAAEEDVNLAVSLLPDLRARGLAVHLRVVRVVELLQHVGLVAERGEDVLGLLHGAAHALGGRRQHHLGAEGLEEHAALHGHGLGHGQDEVVALGRGHHGERNAGVTGGRLHERRLARADHAALLGLLDHAEADAVLHGVARLHGLELGEDLAVAALHNAVEAHQRRAADKLGHIIGDLGV